MKRDLIIGQHEVRLVTTSVDYGSGTFRPGLRLFLKGPNGSVAGRGPKAWPLHWRLRRFRSRHHWLKTGHHRKFHRSYTWTNCLYVPIPHLKWNQARRLRWIGGMRFWKLQYRLCQRLGR